jgi:hypothetical protein
VRYVPDGVSEVKTGSTRFAALVKTAGQPHAVTLWTQPEEDAEFMKAVRGNRVLTVHQESVGQRKDHGEVGFNQDAHATYLVFPKSLKEFEEKRVVGIRYDLLAETPVRRPVPPARTTKRPGQAPVQRAEPVATPEPAPEPKLRFAVTVQRTAIGTATIEVIAKSAGLARKMALERAQDRPFDIAHATIRSQVKAVDKMSPKTNH